MRQRHLPGLDESLFWSSRLLIQTLDCGPIVGLHGFLRAQSLKGQGSAKQRTRDFYNPFVEQKFKSASGPPVRTLFVTIIDQS